MTKILMTILAIALVGCGTSFTAEDALSAAGSSGNSPVVSAGSAGSAGYTSAGSGGSVTLQGGSGGSEAGAAGESSGEAGSAGDTDQGGMGQGGSAGSPTAGTGGTPQGGSTSQGGVGGSLGGSTAGTGGHQGGMGGSAGVAGSNTVGGSSGSGGSVGAVGGMGGTAGGIPGFCDQSGVILCDTFDANPVGPVQNDPWIADSNCKSQVNSIIATQSFSPSHSLSSPGQSNETCGLHGAIGSVKDFYVHARIKFAKATGSADQFDNSNVSLFSVDPNMDDETGIRVGFMGSNLCPTPGFDVHFASTDIYGCTGLEPTTDVWHCLELHVSTNGSTTTADLSVDGQDQAFTIAGLPTNAVTQPAVATPFLNVATVSYSNGYKPAVYVDDVAVSSQPLGCQ